MDRIPKRLFILAFAVFFSAASVVGKDKARAWETGKVLDSERNTQYRGSTGGGTSGTTTATGPRTAIVTGSSHSTALYRVTQTYTIQLGQYIYVAEERLRSTRSKPADLTVNGPVKVAIEKQKLYFLDEEGKLHEADIVKKILKDK